MIYDTFRQENEYISISEAWTLSDNQLKLLIKRTAKSMTEGTASVPIVLLMRSM